MALHWKPEKESLRKRRDIICEVPELLMDVLEHNFTDWDTAPEDPIEIRYYWGRGDRGAAWNHLLRHPPIIEVDRGEGEIERFKPVFEEKYNPYRKKHGADYWAWYVLRWELIPPPKELYPEHQKMRAVKSRSQEMGSFIDWLGACSISLCSIERVYGNDRWFPINKSIETILAEYFVIDLKKIEDEKDAMLAEIREQNRGDT